MIFNTFGLVFAGGNGQGEYVDVIKYLTDKDIIDEHFVLDGNITRGEVAELLVLTGCLNRSRYTINPFVDISVGDLYYSSVLCLYRNNIYSGISDSSGNLFAMSDQFITREQAAIFLVRVFELEQQGSMSNISIYSDWEDVSLYARDAVSVCEGLGIISGYPDHSLRPKGTVTRLEFLKMIYDVMSGFPINCDRQRKLESTFDPMYESKDVVLVLDSESVVFKDEDNLDLVFVNLSSVGYGYGVEFQLEVRENDRWVVVPFDGGGWDDILKVIAPNSIVRDRISLNRYFSDLVPGEYRIVYLLSQRINSGWGYLIDKSFCAVEFNIN